MVPSDYIKSALADLMWNDWKEDSFPGMICTGLLVRNRVLAGWNGGDWLINIEKFDAEGGDRKMPREVRHGDPNRDMLFRRCLALAENIYEGREKDITMGGKWASRLDQCSDAFKKGVIHNPSNTFVGNIGLRTVYK